jgi:hypothetical protein
MITRSIYLLPIAVLVSLGSVSNASAEDRDGKAWARVRDADISRLLEGKRVTPSMRYRQDAPPAGEWFGADHQWHATLQSFSLRRVSGTWNVEGDLICVSRALKPKFCRAIWRDEQSGEISMSMVPEWSWKNASIIVEIVEATWGSKE